MIMMQQIYNRSMTIDEAMDWLSEIILVDDVSITKRLEMIEYDRKMMLNAVSPEDLAVAQIGLKAGVDSKQKLGDILRNAFLQFALEGTLIATAYVSPTKIENITGFDWSFLEFDFQKDCATCQDKKFAQIRVIHNFKMTSDELNALKGDRAVGLQVFKSMDNLTADEVAISFISQTYLEIKARGKTVSAHCDKLGLMKTKAVEGESGHNQQGKILLDMTHKKYPEGTTAGKAVSRLKFLLMEHLNIKGEIFKPQKERWEPLLLALTDERGRADDRAKSRASYTSHTDQNQYSSENHELSEEAKLDAKIAADYGDINTWKYDTKSKK